MRKNDNKCPFFSAHLTYYLTYNIYMCGKNYTVTFMNTTEIFTYLKRMFYVCLILLLWARPWRKLSKTWIIISMFLKFGCDISCASLEKIFQDKFSRNKVTGFWESFSAVNYRSEHNLFV